MMTLCLDRHGRAAVVIAAFVFLLLYGPLFVAIFFSFFRLEHNEVQWDSFSLQRLRGADHIIRASSMR